jgi:hypothetical protein
MAVAAFESLEAEIREGQKDFLNLIVEFRNWLTPRQKIWENDGDQLAELFTEFLRSPLKRVPESTITDLQVQFYSWMRHHPMELHFLARKLRELSDRLSSPPVTEIESWEERWNRAQMESYGKYKPQPKATERKQSREVTTAEKPLRD